MSGIMPSKSMMLLWPKPRVISLVVSTTDHRQKAKNATSGNKSESQNPDVEASHLILFLALLMIRNGTESKPWLQNLLNFWGFRDQTNS